METDLDSGVALPSDWSCLTLGEVVEVLDSHRRPLNSGERSRMQGWIPYYGANGVVDHISQWIFDEPLLLMAEDGGHFEQFATRPIAYLVDGKSWVNNHAHVLRVRSDYDRQWVFYSLVHRDIRPYINSGTRSKLNQADLRRIAVPLPPLPEQRKIAAILASVDEAIEATQAVIDQLQVVKKAMMAELLTRGIPGRHAKFKMTEIGEVPEEWEVVNIGKLGRVVTGSTPSTTDLSLWDGPIPFITPGDLGEIRLIASTGRNLSRAALARSRPVPSRSVLVTCIGSTIGKVGMTAVESCTNQQINSVICGPSVNPEFFYYAVSASRSLILANASQTAVPIINKRRFKELPVVLPSLGEQEEIAESFIRIDNFALANTTVVARLTKTKSALMSVLLTGEVRVQPDGAAP